MKKKQKRLIGAAAAVLLLAAAFWYGGNAPGLHGWSVSAKEDTTAAAVQDDRASSAQDTAETGASTASKDEAAEAESMKKSEAAEPSNASSKKTAPSESAAAVAAAEECPDGEFTCTISIFCGTICSHKDWLTAGKESLVPEDGWILKTENVVCYAGESVFNVMQRTCRQKGIPMEFERTPGYGGAYIEGIQNIYEFDCGERSGWMYRVNGSFPNRSCARFEVTEGCSIEWLYTCDLGADIGGAAAAKGQREW